MQPLSSTISYSSLEQQPKFSYPFPSSTRTTASAAIPSFQNKENFPPNQTLSSSNQSSSCPHTAQLFLPQHERLSAMITESQLDQLFDGKQDTSHLLVKSINSKTSDYLAQLAKHKVFSYLRHPTPTASPSSLPLVASSSQLMQKENNQAHGNTKKIEKASIKTFRHQSKGSDKRPSIVLTKEAWDEVKCDTTLFSNFKIFKPKKNMKASKEKGNSESTSQGISQDLPPLASTANIKKSAKALTKEAWDEIKCDTTLFSNFMILKPKNKKD